MADRSAAISSFLILKNSPGDKKTYRHDGTGNKAAGSPSGNNKKTQEEREEEERKEKAAREAASLQKKEELAKKRAQKSAKYKNKRTRTGNNVRSVCGRRQQESRKLNKRLRRARCARLKRGAAATRVCH